MVNSKTFFLSTENRKISILFGDSPMKIEKKSNGCVQIKIPSDRPITVLRESLNLDERNKDLINKETSFVFCFETKKETIVLFITNEEVKQVESTKYFKGLCLSVRDRERLILYHSQQKTSKDFVSPLGTKNG